MQKFLSIIGGIALILAIACAVTFLGFAIFFHYYPIGH